MSWCSESQLKCCQWLKGVDDTPQVLGRVKPILPGAATGIHQRGAVEGREGAPHDFDYGVVTVGQDRPFRALHLDEATAAIEGVPIGVVVAIRPAGKEVVGWRGVDVGFDTPARLMMEVRLLLTVSNPSTVWLLLGSVMDVKRVPVYPRTMVRPLGSVTVVRRPAAYVRLVTFECLSVLPVSWPLALNE